MNENFSLEGEGGSRDMKRKGATDVRILQQMKKDNKEEKEKKAEEALLWLSRKGK